jgi:hypothetical protein
VQIIFLAFGTGVRAYIIPELISTSIGLLLVSALLGDGSINYVSGGMTITILLPDYFVVILVLLTLFPILYIIMRLHGGG